MNMLLTSARFVPIDLRIPISRYRSMTDIIMTLKMDTPATMREIPPIAMVKVDILPNVSKMVSRIALVS
ncbi:MAG: hypothetical protein BWY45_01746 [Euryarchaeota archaeon ADurb.Bin294]|nr:MAG: hypothetical protein BWY45_01746 [Euryarchaeota archaeon ADurb.Bin294]